MGKDPQEARNAKRNPVKPKSAAPDFWSWHPTEAEKRQFEAFLSESGDLDAHLEYVGNVGISLTLTKTKQGDAFCAVARNKLDSYGSGQALSTFHVSPVRALWGMVFVLTVLHPDWPATPATTFQAAMDW